MNQAPRIVLAAAVWVAAFGSGAYAQQAAAPAVAPATGTAVPGAGLVSSTPFPGIPFVGESASGAASVATPSGPRSGAIMPYSYYATFPQPARVYVGYGPNDGFPFRGQLYGHAGDRWSWSAMSSGNGSLARYYYQILR
jgi:hypothetical protein